MTISLRSVILVIALAFSCVTTSFAQQQSNEISKSQAAEKARSIESGRVLKIDQTRQKYRVKVLKKSGRVVSVDVDKRSGNAKSSKGKVSER